MAAITSKLRWEPNDQGIDYLIDRGRLDRVEASPSTADHLLAEARRHLTSAKTLSATDDTSMAFVACYDAARKALSAILVVQGLRAKAGDGGHTVLLDAVRPQFPDNRRELQRFDWMRTVRNDAEYPDLNSQSVTVADVEEAQEAAAHIVDLAARFCHSASLRAE